MRRPQARELIGGLSDPSKIGCHSFNIPPSMCKRGAKLAAIPGTVCHSCYACQNHYAMQHTIKAMERRLRQMEDPTWPHLFAEALRGEKYFRWFDAGDLQSERMLYRICEVSRLTPHCRHWMPTREYGIVKRFLAAGGKLPDNLCVRLSLDLIDDDPAKRRIKGMPHSVVSTKALNLPEAVDCPATFTEAKSCDAHRCHACWDRNVELINYHQH